MVRFNPIEVRQPIVGLKNSIYRLLNQVKGRYKGIRDIEMSVIKEVIRIYQIPVYYLNNGQTLVDRDLFDTAINEYYRATF